MVAPRVWHPGSDQGQSNAAICIQNERIPTYELLDEENLQRLEDHADWILKEIGIEFREDEETLRLFKDAGADVHGERVRFDQGHARALCKTAPNSFVMEGRDPASAITLGGNHLVLMPGLWPAVRFRHRARQTLRHH